MTVKIDNTYEAHPQYGIRQADAVYEEIVEGGITRLAAVFNSAAPARVGPVRSVRRTDREVVYPLGGIFVFSGGAQYAIDSIKTAPVKLFSEANAGAMMYRGSNRPPPHNLFANVSLLIRQGGRPRPPRALFTYSRSAPKLLDAGAVVHGGFCQRLRHVVHLERQDGVVGPVDLRRARP